MNGIQLRLHLHHLLYNQGGRVYQLNDMPLWGRGYHLKQRNTFHWASGEMRGHRC